MGDIICTIKQHQACDPSTTISQITAILKTLGFPARLYTTDIKILRLHKFLYVMNHVGINVVIHKISSFRPYQTTLVYLKYLVFSCLRALKS